MAPLMCVLSSRKARCAVGRQPFVSGVGVTQGEMHVIDQSGQPYGSVRRCCNRCGRMADIGMRYVHSIEDWSQLPEAQRCSL